MRRRDLLRIFTAATLVPLAGAADASERVHRLGLLLNASIADTERRADAFVRELADQGWRDGDNLRIEYRSDDGDAELRRSYARELVRNGIDVIATMGTPELRAAAQETRTVPIVFMSVSDPVGLGFVGSLAHPGGNITGFANFEPEIGAKWLQLLKEIAPAVVRVVLLFNPTTAPFNEQISRYLDTVAPHFSVQMTTARMNDPAEFEDVIGAAGRSSAGLIVGPDNFTSQYRDRITTLATKHRVPAVYPLHLFAGSGGLLIYGIDIGEQARQAAGYVDRILRGAKPADLPVQAPTKYELVINLKTAKALGLTVPHALLAGADEVIE